MERAALSGEEVSGQAYLLLADPEHEQLEGGRQTTFCKSVCCWRDLRVGAQKRGCVTWEDHVEGWASN